jgi:hypothetical protein
MQDTGGLEALQVLLVGGIVQKNLGGVSQQSTDGPGLALAAGQGGKVLGEYQATGYLPTFLDEFILMGLIKPGEPFL